MRALSWSEASASALSYSYMPEWNTPLT